MKKLIILAIMICCIVLMYQFPHTMLNAGELTKGHQEIKNKCTSCHAPFWGIQNPKCISCHEPSEIGKDTTLTGDTNSKVLFHNQLGDQKCTACHTDHNGLHPEKSLTRFSHDGLEVHIITQCETCHADPGDSLHNQLSTSCNNCHNTKGWESDVTFDHSLIQGIAKTNCVACHTKPLDALHEQLKVNCQKCHTTIEWKPSTFDHAAYFQLDQDHNVECNTCHTSNNFTVFTCYGCHEHSEAKIREDHNEEGIYNFTNCTSCHKNSDEHDIRMNEDPGKFNRDKADDAKRYLQSQKENKGRDRKKAHDD